MKHSLANKITICREISECAWMKAQRFIPHGRKHRKAKYKTRNLRAKLKRELGKEIIDAD